MLSQTGIAVLLGVAAVGAVLFGKRKSMLYPLAVNTITSPFGERKNPVTGEQQYHNGIDLAGKVGTVVAAPASGKVTSVYSNELGGLQMTILHDNGFTTGYAHLSKYAVKLGDRVTQSQIIAYVGATGRVTGPHLHLSLKDTTGNFVNPVNYLV